MADNITDLNLPEDCRSFKELILYKIDRTLAIAGIIALGLAAIFVDRVSSAASQIMTTAIGALAVYIGGRVTKGGGNE